MNDKSELDLAVITHCYEKITARDSDAPLDLAQYFLARIVHKDVESILNVVEGLARISAAAGSLDGKKFLEDEWNDLRPIFKRRLEQGLR